MLRFIFALATLGELLLVASAQEDPLVLIVAGGYDGNFVEGVREKDSFPSKEKTYFCHRWTMSKL